METPIWLSKTLNEIVFDGRNKSYGAFVLRRDYDRKMALSILISISFFLFMMNMPSIIHKLIGPSIVQTLVDIPEPQVTLVDIIIHEPNIKPPVSSKVKASPPHPIAQIKFVPPSVVRDDSPKEENPPTQQEIKTEIIGTTTTTEDDGNGIDPGLIDDPGEGIDQAVIEEPVVSGPVYVWAVEQKPEFPDGELAMRKYIQDHLHIPLNEINGQINILIQFIIDSDGHVRDVNVIRGAIKSFDREAANVVRGMPRWKPGKQNGKPVSVIMTLPIKIQFQ